MSVPPPAGRSGRQRMVPTDGAELWCTVSGNGLPLVCCHGGPGLWDYLEPLGLLLEGSCTIVRFDQRGCGRSTGGGPFSIVQAVDDLDAVRAALGFETWAVLGHSWGAELAMRYAARLPTRTTAVLYIAGIGSGDGYREPYVAERDRRLGDDLARWRLLSCRSRTPAEEREWAILQWRPDFSPTPAAEQYAAALWDTRPPGAGVNQEANRSLWADRATDDLLGLARRVTAPVTMIFGADDPRPWAGTDPLLRALPRADRIVVDAAGHAPWVEQPTATRELIIAALDSARSARPVGDR